MTFPLFKKTSRIERIFILSALVVVGFILSAIVGVVITLSKGSIDDLNILRISQISSQILTFVLPPIIYVYLTKEKPMKSLGFNKTSLLWLVLGVAMTYAILPINDIFTKWNAAITFPESMSALEESLKALQDAASELTDKMLNVSDISGLIINIVMIAGLAAFGEELLFRSLLQPFMIKLCKNAHIGIVVTGAIFSFIHFEFYGFLPRWAMGIILGYMFFYSKSIWVPIAMHFANNVTVVIIYYLNNIGLTNIDTEPSGETNILILMVSIAVIAALFWLTIRKSKNEQQLES